MVDLENLRDMMLKFNVIYDVIDDKANLNRVDWETCQHLGESSVVYFADGDKFGYKKRKIMKTLALASYLTYIPYGELGYKYLKDTIKPMNVGEFRFNALKNALGEKFEKLSQEQVDYIKGFFYNFDKEELNLRDCRDSASFVIRIHQQLEAVATRDFLKFSAQSNELTFKLGDIRNENESINFREVLKDFNYKQELTDEEKEFVLKFVGLNK